MHGGAVTLARRFLDRNLAPDILLVTDMLDLATFLSLTKARTHRLKVMLYMHENQLTYPLPKEEGKGPMRRQKGERDLHYAFINYTSMLSADLVAFNSAFHMTGLLGELPRFLGHLPEFRELGRLAVLRRKCRVIPVGIDWEGLNGREGKSERRLPEVPLLLWNQRWEYDKNPEEFLSVIGQMAEEGLAFEVALCGQAFQRQQAEFLPQIRRLGNRVIHVGFADEGTYLKLLTKANITVSTAYHEFFGISIAEAIACKVFPILPARLSYPELIPKKFHSQVLYSSRDELTCLLRSAITSVETTVSLAEELSESMRVYDWRQVAPVYDQALDGLVGADWGI